MQHPNARAREAKDDWTPTYVSELTNNCGQIVKAAAAAGVVLSTISRRRKSDTTFRELEREALEIASDAAESEARRRAVDGVERCFYDKAGNLTRREIEYSDTILLRLLERNETGSWRQKQQIEHSTPNVFATRAERKAALEKARRETRESEMRSLGGSCGQRPQVVSWPTPHMDARNAAADGIMEV